MLAILCFNSTVCKIGFKRWKKTIKKVHEAHSGVADYMEIKDSELEGIIQGLVSSIRSDSRPEELEKIKKLIKKNVPFTLRSYFSAYLLRQMTEKKEERKSARRDEKPFVKKERTPQNAPMRDNAARESRDEIKADKETRKSEKKLRIVPEGAKTLYINLGKMGHVYARDLVSLITSNCEIAKEDIYLIRLHDKYSFVTMSEENCQKAIEKLEGLQYKNRTIQINLSNKEKPAAAAAQSDEQDSSIS